MHDVSVQFLGSGDALGSGGRLQTCIYVEASDTRCLLDCGASSLIAMKRWGVEPALIDIILLTHLHGDHFGGVPFFIVEAQLISKRTRPLVVAGPPGLVTRMRQAIEVMLPGPHACNNVLMCNSWSLPSGCRHRLAACRSRRIL
jgi:ribonuclease BN (tRNA processing enzyme)